MVTFHHLIRQFAPGIVEVHGLDLDVREEGVLVEKHRATSVVSNMEPVCEEFMIHIINRLLQGDNVSLSCNWFFNCALFSTSRTWIPVVFARPLLNGRAVWHVGIKEIFPGG